MGRSALEQEEPDVAAALNYYRAGYPWHNPWEDYSSIYEHGDNASDGWKISIVPTGKN